MSYCYLKFFNVLETYSGFGNTFNSGMLSPKCFSVLIVIKLLVKPPTKRFEPDFQLDQRDKKRNDDDSCSVQTLHQIVHWIVSAFKKQMQHKLT